MNRGAIASALFSLLNAPPLVFSFTADLAAGNPVLANISDAGGLFAGLPIFAKGIVPGTVLSSISPATLSEAPLVTQAGAALSQGVQTIGRRRRYWAGVSAQPALLLVAGDEAYNRRPTGIPAQDTLDYEIWLYAKEVDDEALDDAAQLNALLDAVDQALRPSPVTGRQTLGLSGVQHCWIEGSIIKAAAEDDELQSLARVPVKVLVPNIGLA